jgi:uncharacterized membrane protein
MKVLAGIGIVVVGFLLKKNPLLVVTVAAVATGLLGGMDLLAVVSALGKAFNDARLVSLTWLVLPLLGLLEREGLQERARGLIGKVRAATPGRLLVVYLAFRQITAALGLKDIAGHAQVVRPLLAPMAEAAAEKRFGPLPAAARERVRAFAAATDNIGLFFGEDVFIAIASILLIKSFLAQNGIEIDPLRLSVWAIPSAVAAFVIHGARLVRLDRELQRRAEAHRREEGEGTRVPSDPERGAPP